MFLAVWIDETKERVRERVVLCVPAVRTLNGALAILSSDRHDDAPGTIISGDIAVLNRFAKLLHERDRYWQDLNGDLVLRAVERLAKMAGASIVPLDRPPVPSTAPPPPPKKKKQETQAVRREPKQKLYPRHITKEAKKIWDEVLERNKELLKKYKKDKQRMWAAAIFLFQREAADRGISPFTKDPEKESHQKKMRKEINLRVNRGNALALKAAEQAFDLLAQQKIATSLTGEKFYESAHDGDWYYVTTYRVMKLKAPPKVAMEQLIEQGWGSGQVGRFVHRVVDNYTDILAEPVGKQLYLYLVTRLTRDQLVVLFGFEEDVAAQTVMKRLSQAGRQWVRTGTLVTIASLLGLMDEN